MPKIIVEVPEQVAAVLDRQARALLLTRPRYIRVLLAAIAAQAERDALAVLGGTERSS